jgi:hypothetical protein
LKLRQDKDPELPQEKGHLPKIKTDERWMLVSRPVLPADQSMAQMLGIWVVIVLVVGGLSKAL